MIALEIEKQVEETDFESPTYEEIAAPYRPIFARVAQEAIQREENRELLFDVVEEMRALGFAALRIPREHGGGGATLPQLFKLMVEAGEADSNLGHLFRAHIAFVEDRLHDTDPEVQSYWFKKILDGELFGAAMAERTEATGGTMKLFKEGEQWYLDGTKYYCTGTIYADWISASALDGEERVSVVSSTTAPGVTRIDDWDGFGQRLTGSGTTKFERVKIDSNHIIRRFGGAQRRSDSYIKALYQLVLLSALAGIGRAVLRDAIAFVQPRTRAFGVPGKSSPRTDPLVQRVVGKLASLSYTAETLVDQLAHRIEETYLKKKEGTAEESLFVKTEIEAFKAQQIVIPTVLEATTLLFEVGGASATSETRRFDRHWRNARTVASHNPAILRERAIGDYYLNGTVPDGAWNEALRKKNAGEKEKNGSAEPVKSEEFVEKTEILDPSTT